MLLHARQDAVRSMSRAGRADHMLVRIGAPRLLRQEIIDGDDPCMILRSHAHLFDCLPMQSARHHPNANQHDRPTLMAAYSDHARSVDVRFGDRSAINHRQVVQGALVVAAHTLSCLLEADHRSSYRVPACFVSACALIDALTVSARLPMKRDVLPVCSAEHPEPDQGIAYVDEIVGFCIELRTERVA